MKNLNIKDRGNLFKFIFPSLIGILIFMTPIKYDGEITIPIAVVSNKILDIFGNIIPTIVLIILLLTALISIVCKTIKPKFIMENKTLKNLFDVTPIWFSLRILAAIYAVLIYFKIGPELIVSENTGSLVFYDLLPILFSIFLLAGLFLPLLLNFGLLEFCGSLLTKVMRPIFKLPGRSSIDCLTSWLGDGTIGVMLTSKQYEQGHYTEREASVIGTTFSAVSITFSLVVISQIGLSHMFVPFYLTVSFAGIVAAIIVPRIPPLSRKPDTYYNGEVAKDNREDLPEGYTPFSYGLEKAMEKASENKDFKHVAMQSIENVLDMWFGVLPIVLATGATALIVAEYTPVFQILGMPFTPLLQLMGIPEAQAAAQTLVVGFTDMLLPSVLGSTITSEMTRFIIACTSVTQLIYLSEVGSVLLGSKIPVKLKDLIIIFLERTLVTLPVITLIAYLIF